MRKIVEQTGQRRLVGLHVSISGHLGDAVERAIEAGCVGTFQIFSCSPRRWSAVPIDETEAGAFRSRIASGNFYPICHMPYLPNLCSPDPKIYSQSIAVLTREIRRCELIGVKSLVVHFGSHASTSVADGHRRLIEACKVAIQKTRECQVKLLLENSSGIRNSVGSDFNHIRYVLDQIGDSDRTGVCFDTCHAFASGYDLRNEKTVEKTMEEFDRTVGNDKLKLIHLNDSKGDLGGAKDRHENIGQGKIGLEGFKALISLKDYSSVPLVLETPVENEGDDKLNLSVVKSLIFHDPGII
ncbi:MAG: deoxyribonuclease IV [Nitrososphaerales archaeon]